MIHRHGFLDLLQKGSFSRQVADDLIKGEQYSYRRVWAYLRYVDGLIVNKKCIYRLMRENNLTVKPNTRLIANRVSERPKPRPNKPRQWWE